jgi:hypothetical protein
VERFLSRVVMATVAFIAALILVAVAIAFLGGALYLGLVSLALSPPLAALLVGTAGFGLAGLIMLAARVISGRRRAPRIAASAADTAAEFGELIAREAVSLAQAHPYRALVISLVAGFTAGASPELRRIFTGLLKR